MQELTAEGAVGEEAGDPIIMFQINGPRPVTFFVNSNDPTQGHVQSRFDILILFDPRAHPEQYEYRQFISGNVTETFPDGHVDNINHLFSLLPHPLEAGNLHEDGDTSVPPNTAGRNYGHRHYAPRPGGQDVYSEPDRRTGSRYEGFDVPEIGPFPIAPLHGHIVTFDLHFHGAIIRRQPGQPQRTVQTRDWVVRGSATIP
jgi:hypothetical protein